MARPGFEPGKWAPGLPFNLAYHLCVICGRAFVPVPELETSQFPQEEDKARPLTL